MEELEEFYKDVEVILFLFDKHDIMNIIKFVHETKEPDKTVRYKIEHNKYPHFKLNGKIYLPEKIIKNIKNGLR